MAGTSSPSSALEESELSLEAESPEEDVPPGKIVDDDFLPIFLDPFDVVGPLGFSTGVEDFEGAVATGKVEGTRFRLKAGA